MKGAGVIFWVIGAALLGVSFFMDTTARYSDTLNMGLLQNQMMLWQGGWALIVGGCILFAAGTVSDKLELLGDSRTGVLELDHEERSAISDEEARQIMQQRTDDLDKGLLKLLALLGLPVMIIIALTLLS